MSDQPSEPNKPGEQQWRRPFDPPYTQDDLPQLDALHEEVGLGPEWRSSERRAQIERGES